LTFIDSVGAETEIFAFSGKLFISFSNERTFSALVTILSAKL